MSEEREDTWSRINFEISVASENIKKSEPRCTACGSDLMKTPYGLVCPCCGEGDGENLEELAEVSS